MFTNDISSKQTMPPIPKKIYNGANNMPKKNTLKVYSSMYCIIAELNEPKRKIEWAININLTVHIN